MKEILKYLRSVNSYSQEKVAESIGLSRQSYNKYEAGTVIPSDKIVNKLADLYGVTPQFIKNNQIPQIPGKEKKDLYSRKNTGTLAVASSAPAYCKTAVLEKTEEIERQENELATPAEPAVQTYRAVFQDGKIVLKDTDLQFSDGQELLITVRAETEEEIRARKEKAWQVIEDLIGKFKFPPELENLSYEEIRYKAMEEKYGPF